MLRTIFGHSTKVVASRIRECLSIPHRFLLPRGNQAVPAEGGQRGCLLPLPLVYAAFIASLLVPVSYAADGVFTNIRATNAKFTNLSSNSSKSHGVHTGTFSGTFTGTADLNTPIFFNCSSHSLSYTLPTSGTVTVIKKSNTSNTLTILPQSGSTIMGLDSYVLYLDNESVTLYYSNLMWYIK